MSRATLFRKLQAEGVTFAQVLSDVRRQQASYYLDEKGMSVAQTAHLLGFAEPSAFSRAFKRWTGSSPRARPARGSLAYRTHNRIERSE